MSDMNLPELPSIYLADCSSSGWKDEEVIVYGRSCYAKGRADLLKEIGEPVGYLHRGTNNVCMFDYSKEQSATPLYVLPKEKS